MVAVIDYDAGNIKSVLKAFRYLGQDVELTRDPEIIRRADHVVLPGVGAFGDAMKRLADYGLVDVIRQVAEDGTPFLGICLGLQLLFDSSEESPGAVGLGILKGTNVRFTEAPGYKIPQIGWNSLHLQNNGRLFEGIEDGAFVYFVHSFYAVAENEKVVKATCTYTDVATASVEMRNVFACQFHPEKSGNVGLQILWNFLNTDSRDFV
ncbi:MAG: imidazole glycerol phosphate synthase subunit HisH [Lachnospiraceae bacterium]|nr:imidazole glycerol phosphate synthase subunit HisH [Lachnospiraceae bacterium]